MTMLTSRSIRVVMSSQDPGFDGVGWATISGVRGRRNGPLTPPLMSCLRKRRIGQPGSA